MATASGTFSYAQAAKGQKVPTTNTTTTTTTSTSTPSTPATPATHSATPLTNGLPKDGPSDEAPPLSLQSSTAVEAGEAKAQITGDANGATAASVSGSSSSANNDVTAPSSADSRREGDDTSTDLSARSEKEVRDSSVASRRTDDTDPARNRGKKVSDNTSRDGESVAAPVQKTKLTEAPIPAVNVWQRRQEDRVKSGSTSKPTPAAAAADAAHQFPAPHDVNKKSADAGPNGLPANGAKAHKAGGGDAARVEVTDSHARRNGPHGAKQASKQSHRGSSELTGEDSAAWPTPDSAPKEEKRKPAEKPNDKIDSAPLVEDASLKSRGPEKKWVKMDFVPTPVFQTPLPQPKSSRPRGGARGGRESSGRGGHNAGHARDGEKAPAAAASNPKAEGRERNRDAPPLARANSLPPSASKRASIDAANFKDQRKPSAPATTTDRPKDSLPAERNHLPRERTDGRGDRPRGGHRGRGGFSNSQMNSQPTYTNGYGPQVNGASRQSQAPYSPPSRQGAFGNVYGGMPSRGGNRGNGRANSNPNRNGNAGPNTNGNMNRANTTVPPIIPQYDGYMQQPMAGGVPFTPPNTGLVQPLLIRMLTSQISYYFSVDNLLRDMHLRQHMDSQGWVPLNVIFQFKRVQDISGDVPDPIEAFRFACSSVPEIEYAIGDDRVERLRRRDNWLKFVLPMESRFDAYRNEGPRQVFPPPQTWQQHTYNPHMMPAMYPMPAPAMMAPNGVDQYARYMEQPVGEPHMNGTSGVPAPHVLSAAVPEFSPVGYAPFANNANGDVKATSDFDGSALAYVPNSAPSVAGGEGSAATAVPTQSVDAGVEN